MNEFTAKKLGEVLAFSNAGLTLFERGEVALKDLLNDKYKEVVTTFSKHADVIRILAHELGTEDITIAKAEATKKKLLSMADTYIAEEWDNPAELMEWFGFFEGAAIIHWQLVLGAANSLNNEELKRISHDAITFHTKLLTTFGELITSYAEEKGKGQTYSNAH